MPQTIKKQEIALRVQGETVRAYLAQPASPRAGMLLIHEWWGLNDWIREQADRFAQNGYLALAVDLYRGKVATDVETAHELSRALPEDRALRDLKAGVDWLQREPALRGKKLGVIGWCMGGGFALSLAVQEPRLSACVIYYGRLLTDESTLRRLRCALLGIFGDQDRGIPVESVRQFETTLKRLGKTVEVHIFQGAGHAFANQNNPRSYNAKAADEAWRITLRFLESHLRP
jgi:carboxymethylenebutenolidase